MGKAKCTKKRNRLQLDKVYVSKPHAEEAFKQWKSWRGKGMSPKLCEGVLKADGQAITVWVIRLTY